MFFPLLEAATAGAQASGSLLSLLIPVALLFGIILAVILAVLLTRKSTPRPQQPWTPPPQNWQPPRPPRAPGNPPVNSDVEGQLQTLQGLKEKGLITQEDYDAKKKQLLGL